MPDTRRTYYDHEPAYQTIERAGGKGWSDLRSPASTGDYDGFDAFVASDAFQALGATTAIDLGCGGGQCSVVLARRGLRVVGIDFSETAVALARQNTAGLDIDVRVDDVLALDGVGPFDLAIDNHVLHCILGPDRARFLASCRRALRDGGILFSETMSAEGDVDFAHYGFDPHTRVNRVHNRMLVTEAELRVELDRAGFEIMSLTRSPQHDEPPCGDLLVTVARASSGARPPSPP